MDGGLLMACPFVLRVGAAPEVTQVTPWQELFVQAEPSLQAGPVAVEVAYRIRAGEDQSFLDTISGMKAARRCHLLRFFKDLGEESRYVERFIVTSWADYLHQCARATVADHALEAQVRAFLAPTENARMSHYIAER